MYARHPKYVAVFLVSALAFTACGDSDGPSPTGPSTIQTATMTAEPALLVPQFFPNAFCARFSPFGAQLTIVLRPSRDVSVRLIRFHFVDRFGARHIPGVIPIPTTSSAGAFNVGSVTMPTSPTIPFPGAPAPFPGSVPLPIPGVSGFDPLFVLGGHSRLLPFFLQFDCGIPADGTVFVDFDLRDDRGRASTSQLRVRLRG